MRAGAGARTWAEAGAEAEAEAEAEAGAGAGAGAEAEAEAQQVGGRVGAVIVSVRGHSAPEVGWGLLAINNNYDIYGYLVRMYVSTSVIILDFDLNIIFYEYLPMICSVTDTLCHHCPFTLFCSVRHVLI